MLQHIKITYVCIENQLFMVIWVLELRKMFSKIAMK